jgi:hypothetical protein
MDRFDDEELQKVILQSRQEYQEQEKKQKQRQLQKQQLAKQMAVPLSRLRLWQRTSQDEHEKTCLHHILQILFLSTHPDYEEEDISIPPEQKQDLFEFLQQHFQSSTLYTNVYKTCLPHLL